MGLRVLSFQSRVAVLVTSPMQKLDRGPSRVIVRTKDVLITLTTQKIPSVLGALYQKVETKTKSLSLVP